jgi:hypothetical protein
VRDDVNLAMSLEESRRRPFATLPWFEALTSSVVHRRLTDMQETSSAITLEMKLLLNTSILT